MSGHWEDYETFYDQNTLDIIPYLRHKVNTERPKKTEKHDQPCAYQYRAKFCCFNCRIVRKSQTRMRRLDLEHQNYFELYHESDKNPTCPSCNQELSYVGPKFRAPKQHDIKAWKSAERLRRADSEYFRYTNDELYDKKRERVDWEIESKKKKEDEEFARKQQFWKKAIEMHYSGPNAEFWKKAAIFL